MAEDEQREAIMAALKRRFEAVCLRERRPVSIAEERAVECVTVYEGPGRAVYPPELILRAARRLPRTARKSGRD